MTELIMICRKKSDVNQTLMLAQEALHKCLGAPEVFTCFFNQKKTILTGRFYVGKRMDITADSFFINIHHSDSPIIRSIKEKRIREWSLSDDVSLHIPSVKKHIKLQKAVFTPILAVGKVIGLYFVGRTTDEPFNEHEKIWLEQIAMYVGMAFESSSRQDANDFMDSGGKND
jgi:GTP-sensing pleiotropic transcriptional regulator CodY